MQKQYDVRSYDFGNFDKYLCLKPPFLLLVAIVFLCRAWLLPIIAMIASVRSQSSDMVLVSASVRDSWWMITTAPATLVLASLIYRRPGSSELFLRIWKVGRPLLILSALLQGARSIQAIDFNLHALRAGNLFGLATLALLAMTVWYLVSSRRVKDTFSDFPRPEDVPTPGKRRRPLPAE